MNMMSAAPAPLEPGGQSQIEIIKASDKFTDSQFLVLPEAASVQAEIENLPMVSSVDISKLSLTMGVSLGVSVVAVLLFTSNPVGVGVAVGVLTVLAIFGMTSALVSGKDLHEEFLYPVATGILVPITAFVGIVIHVFGGGELLAMAVDISVTAHDLNKKFNTDETTHKEVSIPLPAAEKKLSQLLSEIGRDPITDPIASQLEKLSKNEDEEKIQTVKLVANFLHAMSGFTKREDLKAKAKEILTLNIAIASQKKEISPTLLGEMRQLSQLWSST
jgi:hypothetical protein